MSNTRESAILSLCISALLEFIVERNFRVKYKMRQKFGEKNYIISAFVIVILILIIVEMFALDLFGNMWAQGIFMGLWVFSIMKIKYNGGGE